MSNINEPIEKYLNNQWDAGEVLVHLNLAETTGDPQHARIATAYCQKVVDRLENRQRKDPAHKPAAETAVPHDWHGAVQEIHSGTLNSAMSAEVRKAIRTDGLNFAKWDGRRWLEWRDPTCSGQPCWCVGDAWLQNEAEKWRPATGAELATIGDNKEQA